MLQKKKFSSSIRTKTSTKLIQDGEDDAQVDDEEEVCDEDAQEHDDAQDEEGQRRRPEEDDDASHASFHEKVSEFHVISLTSSR